jgi:hypothetical protein
VATETSKRAHSLRTHASAKTGLGERLSRWLTWLLEGGERERGTTTGRRVPAGGGKEGKRGGGGHAAGRSSGGESDRRTGQDTRRRR